MIDLSHMKRMRKMNDLAPAAWKSFVEFDKAAFADGALPAKTKELIALGVALTTQCLYCLEIHKKKALEKGVTEAEIAEAAMVAAVMRAGGAVAHTGHLLSD